MDYDTYMWILSIVKVSVLGATIWITSIPFHKTKFSEKKDTSFNIVRNTNGSKVTYTSNK